MLEIPKELYDIVGSFEECNKEKIVDKIDDFYHLVDAMKSSEPKVRSYVAQAVPEYAQYFPSQAERVINSQISQCEDEDPNVRNAALRGISRQPSAIPIGETAQLSSVASAVQQQLVISEESKEKVALSHAFDEMTRTNLAVCFETIFSLLVSPDIADLRPRLTSFTHEKQISCKDEQLQDQQVKEVVISQQKQYLMREGLDIKTFRQFFINLITLYPITKENCDKTIPEYINILYTYGDIFNKNAIVQQRIDTSQYLCKTYIFTKFNTVKNFTDQVQIQTLIEFQINVLVPHLLDDTPKISDEQYKQLYSCTSLQPYIPPRLRNQYFESIYNYVNQGIDKIDSQISDEIMEFLQSLQHYMGSSALDQAQHATGQNMNIGQPFIDTMDTVKIKRENFLNIIKKQIQRYDTKLNVQDKKIATVREEIKTLNKIKDVSSNSATTTATTVTTTTSNDTSTTNDINNTNTIPKEQSTNTISSKDEKLISENLSQGDSDTNPIEQKSTNTKEDKNAQYTTLHSLLRDIKVSKSIIRQCKFFTDEKPTFVSLENQVLTYYATKNDKSSSQSVKTPSQNDHYQNTQKRKQPDNNNKSSEKRNTRPRHSNDKRDHFTSRRHTSSGRQHYNGHRNNVPLRR